MTRRNSRNLEASVWLSFRIGKVVKDVPLSAELPLIVSLRTLRMALIAVRNINHLEIESSKDR